MLFLEAQVCPFTQVRNGWLFGRWVVFQETIDNRFENQET